MNQRLRQSQITQFSGGYPLSLLEQFCWLKPITCQPNPTAMGWKVTCVFSSGVNCKCRWQRLSIPRGGTIEIYDAIDYRDEWNELVGSTVLRAYICYHTEALATILHGRIRVIPIFQRENLGSNWVVAQSLTEVTACQGICNFRPVWQPKSIFPALIQL